MGWDRALLEAIDAHRSVWLTALARGLSDAGQPVVYVGALLAAVALAYALHAWWDIGAALLGTFVATLIAEHSKEVIGRPRPPAGLAVVAAHGFAMPSSIAAMTAGAAVPLIVYGRRRGGAVGRALVVVLTVGTVSIGAAMVYLGAHWLTDVLAGWVLGAVIGLGASWVVHRVAAAVGQHVGSG